MLAVRAAGYTQRVTSLAEPDWADEGFPPPPEDDWAPPEDGWAPPEDPYFANSQAPARRAPAPEEGQEALTRAAARLVDVANR